MSDPVLIVGASRGLGRDLACRFVELGDTVIGTHTGASEPPALPGVSWRVCDLADGDSRLGFTASLDGIPRRIVLAAAYDPRTDPHPPGDGDAVARSLLVNGAGAYALLSTLIEQAAHSVTVAVIGSEAIYTPDAGSAG